MRRSGPGADGLGRVVLESFWVLLAAKMAATAAIVVVASLIVERSGPFVGALVATLPISAGPAYVFLAAEHGAGFVERASLASLAINAVTFVFCALYAHLAQTRSLAASLGASMVLWLAGAVVVVNTNWTFGAAVALNVVLFFVSYVSTHRYRAYSLTRIPQRRWWDVPFRGGLVVLLVGTVVGLGRFLGPSAAGVAALVPIVMTSLAIILQPRIGGKGAAAVLSNALPGLAGFGFAVTALNLAAAPLGAPIALAMALAVSVGFNVSLGVLRRTLGARRTSQS